MKEMISDYRIHGKNIIKRRNYTIKSSDYHECEGILAEDFKEICGYCGKPRKPFHDSFQIDHFAPKSKFESRRRDYSNMVLACPQCNRLKWDKWIGDNPYISHNGIEGFVDPATEEYDKHLGRDSFGNIIPKSDVGKYMHKIFKFSVRPMRLVGKISKLVEYKEILDSDDSKDGLIHYKEVQQVIDELIDYLRYQNKE